MDVLFNHTSVRIAHISKTEELHVAVATKLGRAGLVQEGASVFLITNQNSLSLMDLSQSQLHNNVYKGKYPTATATAYEIICTTQYLLLGWIGQHTHTFQCQH